MFYYRTFEFKCFLFLKLFYPEADKFSLLKYTILTYEDIIWWKVNISVDYNLCCVRFMAIKFWYFSQYSYKQSLKMHYTQIDNLYFDTWIKISGQW